MRLLTALFILAACQCLLAHKHSHTPRHLRETLRNLVGEESRPVKRIISCTETLGISKCISALGVWRAERALQAFNKDPMPRFNLTEDVEQFPWKKYTNVTDDELNSKLLDGTQKLLQYRPLTFDMISGYKADLNSEGNGSLNIDIHKIDEVEGRSSMKKIQKEFYRILPVLIAPGIFMSALVPFVLPSLKMIIAMVGLMNKIALIGAIFTVMRNNAFDDKYSHKVVYVNNGYDNERLKFAASNNEEHFHTNHLGILYEDQKAHLPLTPHVDPPYENPFGENVEELPPLSVSPQWIKEYTDNKMIALLKRQPNDNIYFNGGIPIRRKQE